MAGGYFPMRKDNRNFDQMKDVVDSLIEAKENLSLLLTGIEQDVLQQKTSSKEVILNDGDYLGRLSGTIEHLETIILTARDSIAAHGAEFV